jgi:non-homologous end joining protein Ku
MAKKQTKKPPKNAVTPKVIDLMEALRRALEPKKDAADERRKGA